MILPRISLLAGWQGGFRVVESLGGITKCSAQVSSYFTGFLPRAPPLPTRYWAVSCAFGVDLFCSYYSGVSYGIPWL